MLINLIIQHIKRLDISAFIQNCILDMYINASFKFCNNPLSAQLGRQMKFVCKSNKVVVKVFLNKRFIYLGSFTYYFD